MSVFERETVVPMPDVLDPRVVRGAELLDERMPGWADRIDLGRFNLESSCNCILGQLGYEITLVADWDAHGWHVSQPNHLRAAEYVALTQDWRLAILSRRSA